MSNSKNERKRRAWPEKRRKAQARRIREHKPWNHTTGPKSAAGKAQVSKNAYKHGARSASYCEIRALLRWQRQFVKLVRERAMQNGMAPVSTTLTSVFNRACL